MTNVFKTAKRSLLAAAALSALSGAGAIAQDISHPEKYTPDGYRIETIKTPKDVEFQIAGLTHCPDNKVYVATRLGEVWSLDNSSKDSAVNDPKWQRFADGLNEPAGLFCEDEGSLLVAQKPELTRLLDVDQDGVADEYVNFASGWDFHDNYHEYNFGPVKDSDGNYYGTLNLSHDKPEAFSLGAMGSTGGYRGWAYKVTPDGEFIPFAAGLRSPAGIGISPKDEIFYTDNQGDWVATSKLHLVEEGKFYGHPVSLRNKPGYSVEKVEAMLYGTDENGKIQRGADMNYDELAAMTEDPVVWIPHIEVANSPGNPEWDLTGGKFGPFSGQIFVGDQTRSNVFRVLLDKVNGNYQGAVINFMSGFQSGNIRTYFDQRGHLWVGQTTGGWNSDGGKPFGLERAVWDGKTMPFELYNISATSKGFVLEFTEALDTKAFDTEKLSAHEWHYLYHANYGSPKQDEKELEITSAKLSKDGKSLEIQLPMTAGKVVMIDFTGIEGKSGRTPSVGKVYYTLNAIPNE